MTRREFIEELLPDANLRRGIGGIIVVLLLGFGAYLGVRFFAGLSLDGWKHFLVLVPVIGFVYVAVKFYRRGKEALRKKSPMKYYKGVLALEFGIKCLLLLALMGLAYYMWTHGEIVSYYALSLLLILSLDNYRRTLRSRRLAHPAPSGSL